MYSGREGECEGEKAGLEPRPDLSWGAGRTWRPIVKMLDDHVAIRKTRGAVVVLVTFGWLYVCFRLAVGSLLV